jgi:hypothetical protein
MKHSHVWWYTSVIPALQRHKQANGKGETSLGKSEKSYLNKIITYSKKGLKAWPRG